MTADSLAVTQDLGTRANHLRYFSPEEQQQALRFAFTQRNTKGDAEGAARMAAFGQALGYNIAGGGGPGAQPTPTSGGGAKGGAVDNLGQLFLILAGVILLVALGLFLYMRMRGTATPQIREAKQSPSPTSSAPIASRSEMSSPCRFAKRRSL